MSELHHAQVNGIRTAFQQEGSGFPLLLLHGFPRDHTLWRKCVTDLAQRFTVVTPDRRGYGETERPADPATYDNATMTQDAIELTRHLGWERFLLAGHDLSAQTAQRLALDYPDQVAGALILDSGPDGIPAASRRDPSGRQWYMDFYRQRGVAEAIMNDNPRLFFSLFLNRNPHLTPEEHEYFVQQFCQPGAVEAVLADYRARQEVDRPWWEETVSSGRKITAPLYLAWGGRGPSGNAPVADAWREVATDVRGGEPVPDAGHYLQEEQPAAVVAITMRFADELGV